MQRGDVINLQFEKGSFSWGNGLYVVDKIVNDTIHMIRVNDDYTLESFDDGKPMITCTGIHNKSVIKTNLIWKF